VVVVVEEKGIRLTGEHRPSSQKTLRCRCSLSCGCWLSGSTRQ
jgi:hypothetical protein